MSEKHNDGRAGKVNLPREFNYRYREIQRPGGSWLREWTVEGPRGAVTFHVTDFDQAESDTLRELSRSAGLEVHYRQPPGYMSDRAPSHHQCEAIGRVPCWHDGTSLYAEETLLPAMDCCRGPKEFFMTLALEMRRFDDE